MAAPNEANSSRTTAAALTASLSRLSAARRELERENGSTRAQGAAAGERPSFKPTTIPQRRPSTQIARWADVMPFPKPMEQVKPTRRKCFIHVVVHSTRHWAQLATALRAAGHAQDWQHDLIFTTAID